MTASAARVTLSCTGCGHALSLPGGRAGLVGCPQCATLVPVPAAGRPVVPTVVVGLEDETLLARVRALLEPAGFEPVVACEAEAVRAAVEEHQPQAVVLDVMLPGALAEDLIRDLRGRAQGAPPRVLLVTTVHNAGAYKRRPTSLYGADDWVEITELETRVVDRLAALLISPGGDA